MFTQPTPPTSSERELEPPSARPQIAPGGLSRALSLGQSQARALFRAARAIVEIGGAAGPRGRNLLDVLRDALGVDVDGDGDALPTEGAPVVSKSLAADLAASFATPAARRAVIDAMLVPACIECDVDPRAEHLVLDVARELGVRSHWAALLPALRRRRVFAIKAQLGRRSPDARRLAARTWEEEGLLGLWRAVLFIAGKLVSPPLATRFRALEHLPEATLGRQFFDHLSSRGLAFPGEKGGLPERMLHHDLMHVVNGYGTDAAGECEIAGFYAGFAEGDAFTFIVIALATFHLGIPVSPAVVTTTRGELDPGRVLAAFLRGRRLRVDVMGRWDYWPLLAMPIDEARIALGLAGDASDASVQTAPLERIGKAR